MFQDLRSGPCQGCKAWSGCYSHWENRKQAPGHRPAEMVSEHAEDWGTTGARFRYTMPRLVDLWEMNLPRLVGMQAKRINQSRTIAAGRRPIFAGM
jgi:hypothetical protein